MSPRSLSLPNAASPPRLACGPGGVCNPVRSVAPRLGLAEAATAADPLPSWNDGAAKQAIVDFVKATTDSASPNFVPPEERIATFDQDGTLWVEHPMYSQVVYCLDRVPALVKAKPELARMSSRSRRCCPATARRSPKLPMHGPREDPRRHAHRHDGR